MSFLVTCWAHHRVLLVNLGCTCDWLHAVCFLDVLGDFRGNAWCSLLLVPLGKDSASLAGAEPKILNRTFILELTASWSSGG